MKLWRNLTGRHHTAIVSTPETVTFPAKMSEREVQLAEDEMAMFGNRVQRGLRELGFAPGSTLVGNHFGRLRVAVPVRLGQRDPEDLIVELGDWLDTPRTAIDVHEEMS